MRCRGFLAAAVLPALVACRRQAKLAAVPAGHANAQGYEAFASGLAAPA